MKRTAQIRGTTVRLYRASGKELISCWPSVDVETEARAQVIRRMWEREGKLPDWFKAMASGLPKKSEKPELMFDEMIKGRGRK